MTERNCPFPNCFTQLACLSNLPVVFFTCDQDGTFTHAAGQLLYDLHPDILETTCWEIHKDDPVGTEHYRKVLIDRQRQIYNIRHKGRLFSVVMEPLANGGLQGIAVLAVDQAEIDRALVQANLHRALECDELELWLQPVANMVTSETAGCEALIRWRTKDNQIIMPDVFLPMANGLLPAICLRVLRLAGRTLQRWDDDPVKRHWWLSVNVAPASISEAFVSEFNAICDDMAIDRSRLHLEITEESANEENIAWFAAIMKRLGHRLKVDDYGTKGSNDFRISNLPFDDVKFDRWHIQKTVSEDGHVNQGMAMSLLNRFELCRRFHLGIIVEGVEHEAQRQWLVEQGVSLGQGWLFGKPQPE